MKKSENSKNGKIYPLAESNGKSVTHVSSNGSVSKKIVSTRPIQGGQTKIKSLSNGSLKSLPNGSLNAKSLSKGSLNSNTDADAEKLISQIPIKNKMILKVKEMENHSGGSSKKRKETLERSLSMPQVYQKVPTAARSQTEITPMAAALTHTKSLSQTRIERLQVDEKRRENSVSAFIVTWNQNGRVPDLRQLQKLFSLNYVENASTLDLTQSKNSKKCTFVVVGCQECERSIEKSILLNTNSCPVWMGILESFLEKEYTLITTECLASTHLAVFVLNERAHLVECVETGRVTTGLGNVVKNKGGVGISFSYLASSFLFITAHLSAGETNKKERDRDAKRILDYMRNEGTSMAEKGYASVSDRFKYVFFLGDLNYRIDSKKEYVEKLIKREKLKVYFSSRVLSSN